VTLNYHRAGSGEPLVLIHGIGSRWQVWSPVLPLLEPHREVIALDLPGFGASPMASHDDPPGVDRLTNQVAEFLTDLGLERPHIAGNSLGGLLTLELAKRGRAASATALSPAGFFRNRFDESYARGSLLMTIAAARLLRPLAEGVLGSPTGRIALLGQVFGHPTRVPPPDAVETLRAAADAPSFFETLGPVARSRFGGGEAINVPVTIGWGELDRLRLPRQAARAAQLLPQARSVWLYDCGHVPTYDDPEQVATVLLQGSASTS
jgi:pimeloyl-ACP methyl ester carboxylesterase